MPTKTQMIMKWIEVAKWAASGGNLQPWHIQLISNAESENDLAEIKLQLSLDQEAWLEKSPLDIKGSASLIALGSLTTNLKYMAEKDSYVLQYELSERKDYDFYQTRVDLIFKKKTEDQALEPFDLNLLLTRHTDRYPYRREQIPEKLIQEMATISSEFTPLKFFNIKNKHSFFSHYFKVECIRWRDNDFVDSLLREINFDLDINKYKNKIPIGQLGLSSLDQKVFKALNKYMFLRRTLQKLLPSFLAFKSLINYRFYSDRIYVIQTSEFTAAQSFELGLLFQELWLVAEKYQMGFQPLGSTMFFTNIQDKNSSLNLKEKKNLQEAIVKIKQDCEVDLGQLSLGFRIGHPSKKPERSPRKNLDDIFNIIKMKP